MNSFFAMHSRMKLINRWALMRNTRTENLAEHSNDVAAIAHAIAVIKNKKLGGAVNAERCAVLGLYHDMPEIITGDMPTPVKYHSKSMKSEFDEVEKLACKRLLNTLPDYMRETYLPFFFKQEGDEYIWRIVKAADKISALIKCIEETSGGNRDFTAALNATQKHIKELALPEAEIFLDEFIESFSLSLDEINKE